MECLTNLWAINHWMCLRVLNVTNKLIQAPDDLHSALSAFSLQYEFMIGNDQT